jgi:hypothetical protein
MLCRNCGADYLRFVGDVDGGPLRPSAVLTDGPEWLLYQPDKFESNDVEDVEGADDGRSSVDRSIQQV